MNLILVKETIFFRGNKILIYDCVVSLSSLAPSLFKSVVFLLKFICFSFQGGVRFSNSSENTHRWGKDLCTAGLQFNKAGLDRLVCSEPFEPKLVKLETSRTVILSPNGECSLNSLSLPSVARVANMFNALFEVFHCTKLSRV